jgi:hypothetical protein
MNHTRAFIFPILILGGRGVRGSVHGEAFTIRMGALAKELCTRAFIVTRIHLGRNSVEIRRQ